MKRSKLISLLFAAALPVIAKAETTMRGMTADLRNFDQEAIETLGKNGWGANIVRLQVYSPTASTDNETEYSAWIDEVLDDVDAILPILEENGVKIIFNLHSPPGGFSDPNPPAQHRVFAESWAQQLLISTWEKVAQRLNNEPAVWGYELMSEPAPGKGVANGLQGWKALQKTLAQTVRAQNPSALSSSKVILIDPEYGDTHKLSSVDPKADPNMAAAPHFYAPTKVTGQGLGNKKMGVVYPQKAKRLKNGKRKKAINKKTLKRIAKKTVRFARKRNMPIFISEFGCVRWAVKGSAKRWLRDIINIFEKNGWNWTNHAFREAHPWSAEHSDDKDDLNPVIDPTSRQLLLQSHFSKNSHD